MERHALAVVVHKRLTRLVFDPPLFLQKLLGDVEGLLHQVPHDYLFFLRLQLMAQFPVEL